MISAVKEELPKHSCIKEAITQHRAHPSAAACASSHRPGTPGGGLGLAGSSSSDVLITGYILKSFTFHLENWLKKKKKGFRYCSRMDL